MAEALILLRRGKVRDVYEFNWEIGKRIAPSSESTLLMVASDRISAFDVVLPTPIPNKGRVLNQLSAFWFDKHKDQMRNHLIEVVTQEWLDSLNSIDSKAKSELAPFVDRAMVVEKADRIDIECIVRGYLTGSAWAEYKKSGTVWGQRLPDGLVDGQVLSEPLFTPTTKAQEGHDQQMSRDQVVEMVGEGLANQLEEKSLALYSAAHDYARQRGIILADTKMEFGLLNGEPILIDELLTPDSSRFWDAEGYQPGRSLPNFDKQYVRDWLDAQGWDHEPPAPSLPEDVVKKTSQRYMEAYNRLTGEELSYS